MSGDQVLQLSEFAMWVVVIGGVWRWFLPDDTLAWGIGVFVVDFAIKFFAPAAVLLAVLLTGWFTVLCIGVGMKAQAECRRWVAAGTASR